MRRHHRYTPRPGRRVALTVAAAMLVGAAAAAVGQSWWGDSRASATSAVREHPAPAVHRPVRPPRSGNLPPRLSDLGEVRGTYQIPGPATAPRGSWVIFAVDGPRRLAHNDLAAPFSFRLDTRTLPDGRYTVTVLLVRPGSTALVWSRGIQVVNGPLRPVPRPTVTPSPPASPGTRPGPSPSSLPGYAAEVLRLTNQQRVANGCRPLTVNSVLTTVAQAHSADMAAHDYFSHDSRDGRSPFDRMTAAGYRFSAAAENIAAGQSTPASVVTAWMNSAGHRANILNCGYTQIGVGYATGGSYGTYWTQDFGSPA